MFNFTNIIHQVNNFKNDPDNYINEEQTKHSLVLPFLKELGYDTSNKKIVEPEFKVIDMPVEKAFVDYALKFHYIPLIFIEVKRFDQINSKDINQLKRYVESSDKVLYGILTDGNYYSFHNVKITRHKNCKIRTMREKPIYAFSLDNLSKMDLEFLMLFQFSNLINIKNNCYYKPIMFSVFENFDRFLDEDYIKNKLKKINSINDTTKREREIISYLLRQELSQILYSYKYIPYNQCETEVVQIKDFRIESPTITELTTRSLNFLISNHPQNIDEFISVKIPQYYIYFQDILTYNDGYRKLRSNRIGMDASYVKLDNGSYLYTDVPTPLFKTLVVLAAISCGYQKKDILFTQ